MDRLIRLKKAIRNLYLSVEKLRSAFPDKPFTPDGRMVGDIGEAIAAIKFNVVLDKKLRQHWDGYRKDSLGNKREVQIKTTQKDETYLKKPPHDGDLLVFQIFKSGDWRCCYDGDIVPVWESLSNQKPDYSGAKFIKLNKLKELKEK